MRTRQDREQSIQETLCQFLLQVPRILWENGKPRVFARELLGLQLFGYRPVFTEHELGFVFVGSG